MRRLSAVALGLVAASVLVAGCSSATPQNTGDNSATGSGTLTIGIADDLPGVSLKTDSGYAGFDIDTANYVAGKLGVPTKNITWQRIDWPADGVQIGVGQHLVPALAQSDARVVQVGARHVHPHVDAGAVFGAGVVRVAHRGGAAGGCFLRALARAGHRVRGVIHAGHGVRGMVHTRHALVARGGLGG